MSDVPQLLKAVKLVTCVSSRYASPFNPSNTDLVRLSMSGRGASKAVFRGRWNVKDNETDKEPVNGSGCPHVDVKAVFTAFSKSVVVFGVQQCPRLNLGRALGTGLVDTMKE